MPETDPWLQELAEERRQKNDFMARHPESPFNSARVPFHELRYFPIDPAYRVPGRLVRVVTPQEAYLRTNRDGSSVMRYIGDLIFRLHSRELHLRVYHAGEGVGAHVFVPFRDSTSGRESYGPGRYLTLELNDSDSYDLDFNRSFNPYCAYTDDYECGFPPAENDLPSRSVPASASGPPTAIRAPARPSSRRARRKPSGAPSRRRRPGRRQSPRPRPPGRLPAGASERPAAKSARAGGKARRSP